MFCDVYDNGLDMRIWRQDVGNGLFAAALGHWPTLELSMGLPFELGGIARFNRGRRNGYIQFKEWRN